MRSRLAASFVLIAVTLLVLFSGARVLALHDLIQDTEAAHLERDASVLAHAIERWAGPDEQVTGGVLRSLLDDGEEARVEIGQGEAGGADRRIATVGLPDERRMDADGWLRASATSGPVSVTIWQSDAVVQEVWRDNLAQLAALGLLLVALAGAAGWLVASLLSRPFHRLAMAAEALGRGRFDLDLPTSKVAEVRALTGALERSAAQLERNLTRGQAYLSEASHQLRTPMAGMRLELDALVVRSDLDPEARAGVEHVRDQLERLEQTLDERLARARAARGMFDNVQVSLDSLARAAADAWTEALASRRMTVQASVDGDLDLQLTPGPVEQVLDLVLADLEESGRGTVALRIHGTGEQVSLRVSADPRRDGIPQDRPRLKAVLLMVEALAGRSVGDPVAGGLRIWLPRR